MDRTIKNRIRIPEIVIKSERISGNPLIRLGMKSRIVDVEISTSHLSCFYKAVTNLNKPYDVFYIKKPRTRLEYSDDMYCLKLPKSTEIEDIDETTKFTWINYPSNNHTLSADEVVDSWSDSFRFKAENSEKNIIGLRKPQLGALHAISAHYSTRDEYNPATIVLPTGTGKTETMLAALVYQKCRKILVMVPSKILRKQLFNKFCELGYLSELGCIDVDTNLPSVARITTGIHSMSEIKEIVDKSNVIIAIPSILNNLDTEVLEYLCGECTDLFVDEAHHISANTWSRIRDYFYEKHVIQFTATPFRTDGKPLGGKIIFNYTIGEAQLAGYFKRINMCPVEEYYEDQADESIAVAAVSRLREDLGNEKEHLVLARVESKERAEAVHAIYEKLAPEYNPIFIHSDIGAQKIQHNLDKLHSFESKIIVCVDMLGEGYDLPNLKIAAIHDHHKSLAITLQFIGRFTRTSSDNKIDDATAIVNIADPGIECNLKQLYSQDAEWDIILRRLSEDRIGKEIDLQKIIDSLKAKGDLHSVISLWNIKPSLSAMLFESKCEDWTPERYTENLPNFDHYWHSISEEENIIAILGISSTKVKWGNFKDLRDINYKLLIAYWNKNSNRLSIFSNDYKLFNVVKFARSICGSKTSIYSGEGLFGIFNDIEFPLVRNLGASQVGAISFTQFFGSNVTEGLDRISQSELNLSNIATIGYEKGEKVVWGCSEKKGKVWSPQSCESILDWRNWVDYAWEKVATGGINQDNITSDFLRPEKITCRHKSYPISVQWGEFIQNSYEDRVMIFFGLNEVPFYLVDLALIKHTDEGPLKIRISAGEYKAIYLFNIAEKTPYFEYSLLEGDEISIQIGKKDKIDFVEYMNTDPIYINYIDGSFSYNHFLIKVPDTIGQYNKDDLVIADWDGINIRSESMGKGKIEDTVQYRAYERIKNDYDVIINDDGSGEAADLVAIKISDDAIKLELIHCKFSASEKPGARIKDFYEVCGQAQRSIRWKHQGFISLYKRLKHRETLWKATNSTRFLKGNMSDLTNIKNHSRRLKINFEVTIVQPGLSADKVNAEILKLLGSTAQYIKKTTQADLNVIISK